MKKILFSIIVVLFVMSTSIFVYADSSKTNEDIVKITSDFNFDDEKISTFNNERTITGSAKEGTVIEISISTKNFTGRFREVDVYMITVGKSGIFSQAVSLSIGENLVTMQVFQGEEVVKEECVIVNRKKRSIKTQLETSVYVPGGSLSIKK